MKNPSDKISVLILSSYMICPPISGGAKRMLAPVLNLSEDAGIEFSVMYMARTHDDIKRNTLYFENLKHVKFSHGTLTSDLFQFNDESIPPDFPKQVWYTMNKDFLNNIVCEVTSTEYDIIQVEHSQLSWVVPKLRTVTKSKIVLDCHNLEYLVFKRWLPYARPEHLSWLESDYMQLKKWEEDIFNWYDDVFCISPVEKRIVENSVTDAKIHYVPAGAGVNDEDYLPKDSKRDKPYDLLFIGSMNWFPTTDALIWLLKDVMPLVWEKRPQTKLEIIGSGKPDPELIRRLKSSQNVTFWGELQNEVPFLHQSKIFISPIRIGAGGRLKNPTAWVSHLPVVATNLSVEGLEYTKDFDVCIGDTPEEMSNHIVALLENKELADAMTENAYKTYTSRYSTERLMSVWQEAYYSVLGRNES